MDVEFGRLLLSITDENEPFCILRIGNVVKLFSELSYSVDDISLVEKNDFATGWQHADGQTGTWHVWQSVEEVMTSDTPFPSLQTGSELSWSTSISHKEFVTNVESMRDDMARGEYFLANLTREIALDKNIDPRFITYLSCLYHQTPFRFFHYGKDQCVLGLSPERFVQIADGIIRCEPMKGTGQDKSDLVGNIKEEQESVMITDLVRADLSQVCVPDTVTVDEQDVISTHPGLVQMSNVITGTLENTSISAAIKKMMPIASVTGTPKPYVVTKIKDYEKHCRDIYCGTYGWIDNKNNTAELAVAIRTIVFDPQPRIGVGAGITYMSEPEKEWDETELKASRLKALVERGYWKNTTDVFTSLRINEDGELYLLDKHCERLANHAAFTGTPIYISDIRVAIKRYMDETSCRDVRLRVDVKNGQLSCQAHNYTEEASDVVLGITTLPSYSLNLWPKFGVREIYDNVFSDACATTNVPITDAIIFENGYAREATRHNFLLRHNSIIIRPRYGRQTLQGIAVEHLLSSLVNKYDITEADVDIEMLDSCDEMIIVNSVRGPRGVSAISSLLLDNDITFSNTTTLLEQTRNIYRSGFHAFARA
jgi:para-aminobenzoate synthetase component 1